MSFKARLGIVYLALLGSIASPFVPTLIACIFLFYLFEQRTRRMVVATIAWSGYAYYEYLIQAGVLCGKECNIRVDLLLLAPILAYCSPIPTAPERPEH